MKRRTKYLFCKLSLWSAWSIILVGFAISLAKLSLVWLAFNPNIVRYQVEKALGQPLSFTELAPEWQGFSPEICLLNVDLLDKKGINSLLHLQSLKVGFDLRRWITSGYANALYLTIEGARVEIERRADGSFHIAGLAMDEQQGQELPWLLRQGELNLLSSEVLWVDHSLQQTAKRLENIDIRLANQGNRHTIEVSLENSEQTGERLQIIAEMEGDPRRTDWRASVYVKGEQIQLSTWLGNISTQQPFQKGKLNIELWSEWQDAYPKKIQGQIALQGFRLASDSPTMVDTASLSADLRWQGTAQDWQLALRQIQFSSMNTHWTPGRMTLQHSPTQWRIAGHFPSLTPRTLQVLLPLLADRPEVAYWQGIQPAGVVRDLRFQAHIFGDGRAPQYRYSGHLDRFAIQAWQAIPGITHVKGSFSGTQDQGMLHIAQHSGEINLAQLYTQPLTIKQLSGDITWQQINGHWEIKSQDLQYHHPALATRSRFLLRLKKGGSPFLDLHSHLGTLQATDLASLLPAKKLSPKLLTWYREALRAGQVSAGNLIVRGYLSDFPFEQEEGRFQLQADIKNLRLQYHPDWPLLHGLYAELDIQKRQVNIAVLTGKIYAARLRSAHLRLPKLGKKVTLEINGTLSGELVSGLRFLQESPLNKRFAALLEQVQASGRMGLDLDITIPFFAGKKTTVQGTLHLQKAKLQVNGLDTPFHGIRGDLSFSEKGMQAKALTAFLGDAALKIAVTPTATQTLVTGKAWLTAAQLRSLVHLPLLRYSEGRSAWHATLAIPNTLNTTTTPLQLQLDSDLQGLALRLPKPLQKKNESRQPLHVVLGFPNSTARSVAIRYGKTLSLALQLHEEKNGWQAERGELRLGGGAAVLPTVTGLRVVGHYPALALSEWQTIHSALQNNSDAITQPRLKTVDLKLDQLEVLGQELNKVHLVMKGEAKQILGRIDSHEIKGHIRIPWAGSKQPLSLHMSRLQIEPPATTENSSSPSASPLSWPLLDISAKQFIYDGLPLGALYLKTAHRKGKLTIEALTLRDKEMAIHGTGNFNPTKKSTDINLVFNSSSFGNTLQRIGFSNIEGGQAEVQLALHWPGQPLDFSLQKLSGSAHINITDGRFLDVEPGVGRALGLMNISLVRTRLKGDFSDLFEEGFPFEHLQGTLRIAQGEAYTQKLSITGPSARIELTGRSSLIKHDYDQTMIITPQLSASLPLAVSIGVSPAAGAAVFVAQKILGDKVDKISSYEYKITGSWEEPVVTPVQPKILSGLQKWVTQENGDTEAFDEEDDFDDDDF